MRLALVVVAAAVATAVAAGAGSSGHLRRVAAAVPVAAKSGETSSDVARTASDKGSGAADVVAAIKAAAAEVSSALRSWIGGIGGGGGTQVAVNLPSGANVTVTHAWGAGAVIGRCPDGWAPNAGGGGGGGGGADNGGMGGGGGGGCQQPNATASSQPEPVV